MLELRSCEVDIYLLDINDNGPVFVPAQLTAYVREGQPAGTHVITLSLNTSDPDLSPNQGPYSYRPLPGPAAQFFAIANDTGVVTTTRPIHRHLHELFHVPVIVYDQGGLGGQRMSSTLTFTVLVTDVNNAPPQPRPLTVRLAVLDGMTSRGVIADVRPLDVDEEGNYTCRIVSGDDDQSVFTIPEGCGLRLGAEPERESYALGVAGSDGSFDEVSYTVKVQVRRFGLPVLHNAVAVELARMPVAAFLNTKYVAFVSAVQSLFGQASQPFVISLREADSGLYVYLAVEEGEGVVPQTLLAQKLTGLQATLESRAGVDVQTAAVQLCASSSDPCLHGGNCSTRVTLTPGLVSHSGQHLVLTSATPGLGEACDCPPAYGGDRCQAAREPCGESFCSHGGTCRDGACACPEPWTGPYCQEDVDECRSQPCQSGGTCTNLEGSFACRCPPDFYGPLCQNRYHCVSHPCLHGATCRDDMDGFRCLCPYGYYGDVCQGSSLGFGEDSFVSLAPLADHSSLIVTGYLATVSSHALLLYEQVLLPGQDKGYLALHVLHGALTLTFRLGGEGQGVVRVQVNGTRVNTGHWYRLEAIVQSQKSSLVVQRCGDDGQGCEPCDPHNTACYSSVTFPSRPTAVEGVGLWVGGVEEVGVLLGHPGEVVSPGLEGCLHSLQVNGRALLHLPSARRHSNVTLTCPRRSAASPCRQVRVCGPPGAGVCVDRWAQPECRCTEEWSGQRCELKAQPVSLGSESRVTYTAREAYRRRQLLSMAAGTRRKRRSAPEDSSSLSLRVRASRVSGVLFSAHTADSMCVVWAEEGAVKLALSSGQPMMVVADLVDNAWHTLTLTTAASNLTLTLDNRPTLSQSRVFPALFPFHSLDIDRMDVGGATMLPNGRLFKGLEGCISEFRINGQKLPLNGTSERYTIRASGGVVRGCEAVCRHNPCGEGYSCRPNGELYNCSALALAAEQGGLQPGIIVVIALSVLLLIAIVIIFVLFQVRRGWFHRCLPAKQARESGGGGKNLSADKLTGGDSSSTTHSRSSPRYADNAQLEEMIIRNHIAEELAGQKTTSLSVRPDLIGSNLSELAPPPTTTTTTTAPATHFADGTMIIENVDHSRLGVGVGGAEGVPEHYDLENASSIAPSDSDVIQHYQRFRHSRDLKAHLHPHTHHSHHPHQHRDRHNSGQHVRDGTQPRQSPVSVTGSALSMPARPSPLPLSAQSARPASALTTAPYAARDVAPRGVSGSHVGGSRSQGSNSLGSHHSHTSSTSSSNNNPPPPPQPNGHAPRSHHHPHHPPSDSHALRYTRGLTVDEVNRLNARADLQNTASMLEAVSSSSEDHPHPHHPHPLHTGPTPEEPLDGHLLLDPPDSSDSDDSGANDSFTCSEFEYDNERGGRMETPKPVFSKLPEVAEDDVSGPPTPTDHQSNGGWAGGGPPWVEDRSGGCGALELDSVLNLGPHFHKLMGVFADIALLPDTARTLQGAASNDHEEYV
ncbi:cadherin-related tumor suppressor-like [Babylonia areolata]|uniref:cadherin-related tumor suppressor-like n=1 Tax=Babylonia areolata TaxID=304850 RepID=UPI003FD29F6A